MNNFKKKKIFKRVIIIFLILLPAYIPAKIAVKLEDLSGKSYVIVRRGYSPLPYVSVIGENGKIYKQYEHNDFYYGVAFIEGKVPMAGYRSMEKFVPDNIYVCYGEYTGYGYNEIDGSYRIFYATKWDVLYPVHRDFDFFWLPKGYYNLYDYLLN